MLDKNTFGNSNVAEDIATRLNKINNLQLTSNVSRFLTKNHNLLHKISIIPDEEIRIFALESLKRNIKSNNLGGPKEIKDRVICHLFGLINHELFGPKKLRK